jgi:hypothetical protein
VLLPTYNEKTSAIFNSSSSPSNVKGFTTEKKKRRRKRKDFETKTKAQTS